MVLQHIRATLPLSFDLDQFAYKANTSTEDAISTTVYTSLTHLEHQESLRMLFMDYRHRQQTKLRP